MQAMVVATGPTYQFGELRVNLARKDAPVAKRPKSEMEATEARE
jgi:hypothetical protein